MDNTQDIAVLSLCAGYGGLELGLARALANPLRVVAVEIEAYALANLVAKAEEGKLAIEALWPDLRTFPAKRFRGCFDFVISGYPCQPFSVAGKRQGADDPRHLWPAIARIIAAVEPLWCFFENVPGHLSLGFPDVYCSLRDMGYKVEAGLFTAAECGAPHKRERLFILAHRQGKRNLPIQQQRQRSGVKSSGEAMADAGSPESGRLSGCQRQENPTIRAAGELANCTSERRRTRGAKPKGFGGEASLINGGELADAAAQRVQGPEPAGPTLSRRPPDEQGTQWPARPGQPQYEWEEPRVVGDAEYTRQRRSRRAAQRFGDRSELCAEKAQSRVGRAVDGTANRVDRLRLLGNGVVPQQAEKAFRALYEQIVAF